MRCCAKPSRRARCISAVAGLVCSAPVLAVDDRPRPTISQPATSRPGTRPAAASAPRRDPVFAVHFVDVGIGDAAIIDVGDHEIVIDGGDSINILADYAQKTGVIADPIELLVISHQDIDHWRGLGQLLGFDGVSSHPFRALELWDPGYDGRCHALAGYAELLRDLAATPGLTLVRPLGATHRPATITGAPRSIVLPQLPEAKITVLAVDARPHDEDCAYEVNDTSIVLMLEIDGVRMLFAGDETGKQREQSGDVAPGHVEARLLALEQVRPGTLRADVLKVPHHGSETSSTQEFIDAVNPRFVIISASAAYHVPKATVVQRYDDGLRTMLRTDRDPEANNDHIVCRKRAAAPIDCRYASEW